MKRRERLERKLEKRREWAERAQERAGERMGVARAATKGIPFGQPILVGHHSERRHRAAIAKSDRNMSAACAEYDKSKHHAEKADGLERQLERSIYSDDDNAIVELEARIAEREKQADHFISINKAWRKGGETAVKEQFGDAIAAQAADTMRSAPWLKSPLDATYLRANIRRDRERIAEIKARAARTEQAEQAGGVAVVDCQSGYCRVTFAVKPARMVLDALKAAGFWWSKGSWAGLREKLPACVVSKAGAA